MSGPNSIDPKIYDPASLFDPDYQMTADDISPPEPEEPETEPLPVARQKPADVFADMSLEDKLAALYGGEVGDTMGFDRLSAPAQPETDQISMESPLVETTPDESYDDAVAELWSHYVEISNLLQRQKSPDSETATANASDDNKSQGTVAEMNPNPEPSKA